VQDAKKRLLDAAEMLFASRDFSEVSVRELAAAAEVNIAAVNYHFQGKENLYNEVITRRYATQRDRTLRGLQDLLERAGGQPQVEEVIRVFVGEYLDGALSNNFLTMIAREMHGCRHATQLQFFREMVAPVFAALSQALTAARPSLSPDDLSWIIASIIAQIHHFVLRRLKAENCGDVPEMRAIMLHSFPVLACDRAEYIRQTTDHITRFSTAAMDGLFPEGK